MPPPFLSHYKLLWVLHKLRNWGGGGVFLSEQPLPFSLSPVGVSNLFGQEYEGVLCTTCPLVWWRPLWLNGLAGSTSGGHATMADMYWQEVIRKLKNVSQTDTYTLYVQCTRIKERGHIMWRYRYSYYTNYFSKIGTCGWLFKEILRNRLSLTWGWPEVLSMAPVVGLCSCYVYLQWKPMSERKLPCDKKQSVSNSMCCDT